MEGSSTTNLASLLKASARIECFDSSQKRIMCGDGGEKNGIYYGTRPIIFNVRAAVVETTSILTARADAFLIVILF